MAVSNWSLNWNADPQAIEVIAAPSLSVNDLEFMLKRKRIPATSVAVAILIELYKQHQPISVPKLMEILSKRFPTLNKTTVYRQLYKFCEKNIVIEVHFGKNKQYFELAGDEEHDHICCKQCERVDRIVARDVLANLKEDEQHIQNQYGWGNVGHNLTFMGVCPSCRNL